MRIRKIKEKDVAGASELMRRLGVHVDEQTLSFRLHDFQYKRNHTVVVVWHRGCIISLMHIGIEPSLTSDRKASVFSMFVDINVAPAGMEDNLIAYAQQWAGQHGCSRGLLRRDMEDKNKAGQTL